MAPNPSGDTIVPNADEISVLEAAKDHPDVKSASATTWATKRDDWAREHMPEVTVRVLAENLPDDLQAIAETHKMDLNVIDEDDVDDLPLFQFTHESRD